MSVITINCDLHGQQTMIPSGLHLTIRKPGRATVEFFSTCCKRYQVRDVNEKTRREVQALGVATTILEVPAEAREMKRGGPILLVEINVWLVQLYGQPELEVPAPQSLSRR